MAIESTNMINSVKGQSLIEITNTNLLDFYNEISFVEETHKYTITGLEGKPIKSVSSLLKYFYDDFPANKIAPKYAKSRGVTTQQVLDAWSGEGLISTTKGTAVHLVGENYAKYRYFNIGEEPSVICKQSLGAIQFLNDLPNYLIVVALELQMYDKENWYCGTCDGVLLDSRDGKLVIYDYKTNNEIQQIGKSALKILPKELGLKQDNYGKYTCQFSFYQLLLERSGYEVKGRILVWLNEDKENKKLYRTFKTPNITKELKTFLESKIHL